MKTKKVIETNVEGWEFGFFDGDEFFEIVTDDETITLADRVKCTPALVNVIRDNLVSLQEYINDDLKEIWRRLDEMEKVINDKT